jgi:hypothetical protein
LLIEVKTHSEAVGAFAVEHIEFAAFGARGFADEGEFDLGRSGSRQQPAENDLVHFAALLRLDVGRHRRIRPEHTHLAAWSAWCAWSSGPSEHYTAARTSTSHSGDEVIPDLIAVESDDPCPVLVIGCFLDLVRHKDFYFDVAFYLSFPDAHARRAGDGEALQLFQFLLVADSGAGLFEYLLGLRFCVRRLSRREGRNCDNRDN